MIRLVIAAFLLTVTALPALAETQSVDLSKPMLEISGKPAMDESTRAPDDDPRTDTDCKSCKPMSMAQVVIRALMLNLPSEQNLAGEQKLARWNLAQRIQSDPAHVALQSSEVILIKRLVGNFGISAVGQIYPLIAPNDKAPDVAP